MKRENLDKAIKINERIIKIEEDLKILKDMYLEEENNYPHLSFDTTKTKDRGFFTTHYLSIEELKFMKDVLIEAKEIKLKTLIEEFEGLE